MMDNTQPIPASGLLAALETSWAALRRWQSEIPDVVMILGPGDDRPGYVKFGHWSPARWSIGAGRRPEVLITGECFRRPARDIFGTLIHEAAHALAHVRKVEDTSRDGRYHNTRFRAIAEALGLICEKDPAGVNGWHRTSIRPETCERFAAEIQAIDDAHAQAQRARRGFDLILPGIPVVGVGGGLVEPGTLGPGTPEPERPGASRGSRVVLACSCAWPRKITVAAGVAALGEITCSLCRANFEENPS